MIVVPVYEKTIAPDATLFMTMEQLRRYAGGKGVAINEKVVLLVAKENSNVKDLSEESFYPIGLAGIVKEIYQQGYVTIRTQYRVNVEYVNVNPDHTIQLTMSRRPEQDDLNPTVEAGKVRSLKEEMRKFSAGFEWAESADFFVNQIDNLATAACNGAEYDDQALYDRTQSGDQTAEGIPASG